MSSIQLHIDADPDVGSRERTLVLVPGFSLDGSVFFGMRNGVLGLGRGIGSVFTVLGYVALTPVLTFYLLRDWDGFTAFLADLLPSHRRESFVAFAAGWSAAASVGDLVTGANGMAWASVAAQTLASGGSPGRETITRTLLPGVSRRYAAGCAISSTTRTTGSGLTAN